MVPLILLSTECVKFLWEDRLSWCLPLNRTCQQQTWMHSSSMEHQHLKTPLGSAVVDCLEWPCPHLQLTCLGHSPSHISGIQSHLQPVVRHLSPHAVLFTASPQLQEKRKNINNTTLPSLEFTVHVESSDMLLLHTPWFENPFPHRNHLQLRVQI